MDSRLGLRLSGCRRKFAWFDQTNIEATAFAVHLPNVPLSRIYMVADEAERTCSSMVRFRC